MYKKQKVYDNKENPKGTAAIVLKLVELGKVCYINNDVLK